MRVGPGPSASRSRSGSGSEARYATDLPSLFAEVRGAAEGVIDGPELARLEGAIAGANVALEAHGAWVAETIADASDDWPLGAERYDELVRLRAFEDLDADAILQIGNDQLQANLEARRAAAQELEPGADLPSVIERLKTDRPATFEEALAGYRDVDGPRPRLPASSTTWRRSRTTSGSRSSRPPSTCAR